VTVLGRLLDFDQLALPASGTCERPRPFFRASVKGIPRTPPTGADPRGVGPDVGRAIRIRHTLEIPAAGAEVTTD
jgi:hypothetical protein